MLARSTSCRLALGTALSFVLLAFTPARAQQPNGLRVPEELRKVALAEAERLETEREPEVRRAREHSTIVFPDALSGSPLNSASIVAGSEGKRAVLKVALPLAGSSDLVLKASAPLSEDDARSSVFSAAGLADKGSIGGELRFGRTRLHSISRQEKIANALLERCMATKPAPIGTPGANGGTLTGCDVTTLSQGTDDIPALKELLDVRSFFFSLQGSVGRQTFKYVDSGFTDQRLDDWSKSGAITVAWLSRNNTYLAMRGKYEVGHEASKTQAVCSIAGLNTSTACPSKVVGAPSPTTLRLGEVEIRRYLPKPDGMQFNAGVSAILRYDDVSGDRELQVPLYIIRDKDGGLSGGVSGGYVWSNDAQARGARFTVFVGQAFGIGE